MRKQKQGERHIIDVIYEDIIEPMFEKNSGVVLKKTMYYKELFNEKIDNGKVLASGLRNHNVRLSERKKENMWEKSNTNWLSDYFRNAENFEEIILNIKNELKEYIKKFISNINAPIYEDLSIEKLIVILIICEDGNYIETERISKNVKFYLREDLKEKLKGLLGINSEEPEFESKRVISISGPKLSGRHTLVDDVLNEVGLEKIHIREYKTNNGLKNIKRFRTEAEKFLKERMDNLIFFAESETELLRNVKNDLVIIIDVNDVNKPNLSDSDFRLIEGTSKSNKIQFILLGGGKGDIETKLYDEGELIEIFLKKMEYNSIDEAIEDGISEKDLIQYCERAKGHAFLVELLVRYLGKVRYEKKDNKKKIKKEENSKVGVLFEKFIKNFYYEKKETELKKFRLHGDGELLTIKGHIKVIYGRTLSESEKSLLYILACFKDEFIPLKTLLDFGDKLMECYDYLERLGWVEIEYSENERQIRTRLSLDVVKKMYTNLADIKKEKEKLETILCRLIRILDRKDIIPDFFENLYGLSTLAMNLINGVERGEVDKKKRLLFYKSAFLYCIDCGFDEKAEVFLENYKILCGDEDFTYKCFGFYLEIMKGDIKESHEEMVYKLISDQSFKSKMNNEDTVNLVNILKIIQDFYIIDIIKNFHNINNIDFSEDNQLFVNELIVLIRISELYKNLLSDLDTTEADLKEQKKFKGHYYTFFIILFFLYAKFLETEYFTRFKNLDARLIEEKNNLVAMIDFDELERMVQLLTKPNNGTLLDFQEKFGYIDDIIFCICLNKIIEMRRPNSIRDDMMVSIIGTTDEKRLLSTRKIYIKKINEFSPRISCKHREIDRWEKYMFLHNEK